MSRVFISYRHVGLDQEFAKHLAAHLQSHGHIVFLDVSLHVGARWVEEIESHIRDSQFFVAVLSKDSILSDMVRREIEMARALEAKGLLRILPVRIGFRGELPYDLAAYLNPIQYAFLNDSQAFEAVCDQITAAIEHFESLPEQAREPGEDASTEQIRALAEVTTAVGAPLPAADPRLETGAMAVGSPFYVTRGSDAALGRALHRGSTIIVNGPRQSGKSSLLARACATGTGRQWRVCYIDFQFIDHNQLGSLEALLRYFAWKIARILACEAKPEPWDASLGHKEMLTTFIEDAVLNDADSETLLVLAEVDRVFEFPYRDDFFALIRGWHNRRATHTQWAPVSLLLAHSTDPTLWIQDINQSPFNVGEHIQLEDFTAGQIRALAARHGLALATPDVAALHVLTGGHPYLVRQGLYHLATGRFDLPGLTAEACDERGPFGDHLRQLRWRLHRDETLNPALQQILRTRRCEREDHFIRLKAAGLVRGETCREAEMRCDLYKRYFRGHLESQAGHRA